MGCGTGSGAGIASAAVSAFAECVFSFARGAVGGQTAFHHRGVTAAYQRGCIHRRGHSTGFSSLAAYILYPYYTYIHTIQYSTYLYR